MHPMNRYALLSGLSMILLYIGLSWYWHETPYLSMLSNVLQSLAAFYGAVLLLNAYRQTKSKYWVYYFIGACCDLSAQLYWTLLLIIFREEPGTFGFSEIVWMIQYVFYIMALHNQNQVNNKKLALRFTIDVLLFTTVTATMYWRYFIEPMMSAHLVSNEEVLFDLFCSSANAVILFGLLVLYIYERVSIVPRATLLLMVGFLLKSCGNTSALYLRMDENWSEALGWLPDLCWFAGLMFLGFSALCSNRKAKAVRSNGSSGHYVFRRYVPLIIVCILMIAFLLSSQPLSVTLFGLMVAFVLLLMRLLVGIRDYESADEALQESTHNYHNLVDNALVGVFIEQDGRLVYVNPYCEQLFGYGPGEMAGQPLSAFVSIAEQPKIQAEFAELGVHGVTPRLCFECRRKDQSALYVDLQATTTLYQGKTAISGTLLDITERKLSEQLLIRSEKLSVVGQLAAGVAHEIRNPLTALKGFTQLLYKDANANRHYYEIMLAELERINYIVGEFMVLSKPHQWQQLGTHDLQGVLEGILPIIESQAIIHSVAIQVKWDSNVTSVRCDANQIKQVFLNLLKNSIEAMPDGGSIVVRFENASKEQVAVSIEDTGVGIPEEILSRLGEPFFSTKDTGTGLGLMICYKIIQAHGGSLQISSKPDKGTVVRIGLPVEH